MSISGIFAMGGGYDSGKFKHFRHVNYDGYKHGGGYYYKDHNGDYYYYNGYNSYDNRYHGCYDCHSRGSILGIL